MFQAFGLDRNAVYDIHITDHTNTYIDPEDLIDILQIYNTGDFTLCLKIIRKAGAISAISDPENLKTYITQQELGLLLFEEYDKTDGFSDKSRKNLVKYLAYYVLSIGGGAYDIENLRSVIQATTILFPYFKAGADVNSNIVSSTH